MNTDTDDLYERIAEILEEARAGVARAVNTAMVVAYWEIGASLVEQEQRGRARADYGRELIEGISDRLTRRFGRGFSKQNLWRIRQFYVAFPEGSMVRDPRIVAAVRRQSEPSGSLEPPSSSPRRGRAIVAAARRQSAPAARFPPNLSWTHYRKLLTVDDSQARAFYELEAARNNWSTRELERQIDTMLFERLAKSRNAEQIRVLVQEGQRAERPTDVVKDPMVLEFLGLPERPHWREHDLEQAIIDRLETFLLELGKGFCFVGRQKRLTVDGDHFFVDLVFYHRLLRCFVLIDLKLGKLTHQDLGQMQMYVHYFDRFERVEHENPTVGIVLCSDKNDAMVEITLPKDNEQILASRYQLHLPSAEELRVELTREREAAEEALEIPDDEPGG
ncbi:PDDEXK nuclease domain-containing protein [Paraliomyxa miuraensis]|uniref:PDDEXK nuclease domain-containing protein n=1 Tax=Paraliomyxa miuraensis TaxID=376150 RepID=UPI0022573454|nr:PDDEXK nuclease domain-containing protein [Paraliomyxa miuraensis]MCX4242670.1 PDDEXK nuclease domain-containing protein [Paraliomyxa miuraensis]